MDLSQAEAVMDLISARSERALAAAREVLRGALGRHLAHIVDGVLGSLATVEAYIDFPDEDLPPEDARRLHELVGGCLAAVDQLLATERTGALLRDGIRVVIVGEPNAGKSSLLNRIVGSDRAIVSPEPGTTRDFLEERINVGPHGFRIIDTAGLNAAAAGIERLGVDKTLERASEADLLVLVLDSTRPSPQLPQPVSSRIKITNTIVVFNKADLLGDGVVRAADAPAGIPSVTDPRSRATALPRCSPSCRAWRTGFRRPSGTNALRSTCGMPIFWVPRAPAWRMRFRKSRPADRLNFSQAISGVPWVPWVRFPARWTTSACSINYLRPSASGNDREGAPRRLRPGVPPVRR